MEENWVREFREEFPTPGIEFDHFDHKIVVPNLTLGMLNQMQIWLTNHSVLGYSIERSDSLKLSV